MGGCIFMFFYFDVVVAACILLCKCRKKGYFARQIGAINLWLKKMGNDLFYFHFKLMRYLGSVCVCVSGVGSVGKGCDDDNGNVTSIRRKLI